MSHIAWRRGAMRADLNLFPVSRRTSWNSDLRGVHAGVYRRQRRVTGRIRTQRTSVTMYRSFLDQHGPNKVHPSVMMVSRSLLPIPQDATHRRISSYESPYVLVSRETSTILTRINRMTLTSDDSKNSLRICTAILRQRSPTMNFAFFFKHQSFT